jgi:hypothetical protein
VKIRLWKNKVHEIKNINGEQISGYEQIKKAANQHYAKLCQEESKMDLNAIERMLENIPKLLSQEDNGNLNKEVTEEEIWEVIKSMNPDKAPRPNGFSTHFYQKC